MISTIRFLKPNRYGRAIGATDVALGGGIHQILVQRGIAEFVSESAPLIVAGISEPELSSETYGDSKPRRHRKAKESSNDSCTE